MHQSYIKRTEAEVVQFSYEKYKSSRRVRFGLLWAFMNLIMAGFAIWEILYGTIFQNFTTYQTIIWYIEAIIAVWCSLRFLSEMIIFLSWLMENPVLLTPKQYQLLAVNRGDSRFSPVKPNVRQDPVNQHSPCMNVHKMSPVIPILSPSTVCNSWSVTSSPMQSVSDLYSCGTNVMSHNMSSSSYNPGYQPDMSVYQTPTGNMSLRNRLIGNSSPYSPSKFSPVHYNDITMTSLDTSHMARYPSPSNSPFSDDRIKNVEALNSYLQTEEDKRDTLHKDGYSNMANTSGIMNVSHSPYQWSPYKSYTEYSTPLSVYKIGTRSPLSATSKDEDEFGHMSPQAEELWLKFGATRQDLDIWTENLRKWISQTVLCKLVQEIDEINVILQKMGSSELQIGLISLGSLRQVSSTKAEHLPTLAAVLPYLELSYNQEYLVKRIKELGQDSCMGAYRWKSGSDYRGRSWDQDLPTDAQIVMHVFCTYMDSRLPTDARFQDGRTFTGLYFLKNLDKAESRKRDLAIHRFRQNPPHFKVITGDEVYDVGKGRNNLFHSIILFLFMVKRKQHGMLGRVNLGPSGVNILGIFTER